MWFPGRQLRDYAIPVAIDELELGNIYFKVVFLDADCKIPEWFTLVFVEKRASAGNPTLYYFQDVGSYLSGLRHTDKTIDGEVQLHYFEETGINGIYGFDEALDIMLKCSLRRNSAVS